MHLSLKILEPLIVFFIFVLLSLFLGDGLQPITVALGALTLVLMLVIARYKKLPTCSLPPLLHTLWLVLIGYIIIRSLFSDSIGLSITATIRIMCAYLIFYFFAAFGKREWVNVFMTWLVRISLVAIVISFILLLVPRWGYLLPPMNLVFAGFGHNQIVSLLFLTMPLIVKNFLDSPTVKNSTIFLLYIIGFVVSFSRGSLIMLTVLFAYLLISNRKHNKKVQSALLITLATTLFLLLSAQVIVSKVTNPDSLTFIPQFVRRQLVKPFTLEQTRLNYWQQAVSAFKDQPLFGHGPGTFYLLSKRYQEAPNQYSYFAHSFPLETLAESGVIGFGLLATLIFLIIRQQSNNKTSEQSSLLKLGLILTLAYSFFEFNLNFLTIWLIWWAGWGVLSCKQSQITTRQKIPRQVSAFLLLLLIFYVLSISSLIVKASKLPDATKLAYYLTLFDRYHALEYLKKIPQINQQNLFLIIKFHGKDAEVVFKIAQQYAEEYNSETSKFYRDSVLYDPKNSEYQRKYLQNYFTQKDLSQLVNAFTLSSKLFLPANYTSRIMQLDFTDPALNKVLIDNKTVIINEFDYVQSLQKLFFLIGMTFKNESPHETEKWWLLARDLQPHWGYYHMALAVLERDYLHDPQKAEQVLFECQQFEYVKEWCKTIDVDQLPNLESLEENIRATPKIL